MCPAAARGFRVQLRASFMQDEFHGDGSFNFLCTASCLHSVAQSVGKATTLLCMLCISHLEKLTGRMSLIV